LNTNEHKDTPYDNILRNIQLFLDRLKYYIFVQTVSNFADNLLDAVMIRMLASTSVDRVFDPTVGFN